MWYIKYTLKQTLCSAQPIFTGNSRFANKSPQFVWHVVLSEILYKQLAMNCYKSER
jgi:hypothetical protein